MILRFANLTAILALCLAAKPVDPPLPDPDAAAAEFGPAIGEPQLALYFTEPTLQAALGELQAGRPANALRRLPRKPVDSPVKWLRAMALRADEQPRPARALFEELALEGGPLADRALHLAALCAVDQGNGAAAERLFAQVSLRYVEADQVLLERARQTMQRLEAGPRTAARVEDILQPIFAGQVRADVAAAHLIAGDAQLAAGAREKARAHWRSGWVEHPLSAAADSAREREGQLGPGSSISSSLLLRRAEILLDAHRNRDALEQLSHIRVPSLCNGGCPGDRSASGYLKAALLALGALPQQHQPTPQEVEATPAEPADPLACRVRLDQGRALRKEREYGRARAALAQVVLRCSEAETRSRALFVLAQIETVSNKPTAGPLWEALARKYPESPLADDALYYEAIAARRASDPEKERALLDDLVDHHPDSDLRADALFRLFWAQWTDGRPRQGLRWLDQLAAGPESDGYEEERARYWRARVLLEPQAGETDAARASARETARTDLIWLVEGRPLTYYGLLAHGRLVELDPDRARAVELARDRLLQSPPPPALHAGTLARDPHLLAAIELLRLGLKNEAAKEISAIDRSPARSAGEAGYEPLTLVAELYSRAGDLRNAHAVVRIELRSLLRKPGSALARRAAALAYPLAFREQIEHVSETAAIPPDLLQAVLREESALDPRALSPTGALGLTQLMPATARMVARKLKLNGFSAGRLLDPEVNIRLGGTYLGELYARFQHPALALASYNAGPGAVSGWLKARGTLPLDAFVEEIPLDETRGYVKRCLRSFAAYQFLYSNGHTPALGQTLAAR
ncbi:MAG TPA: transglycosylase SLT domain-containing protein [Myxococcales bacterium]|nr:transglycosylase SLT domain-containing protein [Myxococcales bacterium]